MHMYVIRKLHLSSIFTNDSKYLAQLWFNQPFVKIFLSLSSKIPNYTSDKMAAWRGNEDKARRKKMM